MFPGEMFAQTQQGLEYFMAMNPQLMDPNQFPPNSFPDQFNPGLQFAAAGNPGFGRQPANGQFGQQQRMPRQGKSSLDSFI